MIQIVINYLLVKNQGPTTYFVVKSWKLYYIINFSNGNIVILEMIKIVIWGALFINDNGESAAWTWHVTQFSPLTVYWLSFKSQGQYWCWGLICENWGLNNHVFSIIQEKTFTSLAENHQILWPIKLYTVTPNMTTSNLRASVAAIGPTLWFNL